MAENKRISRLGDLTPDDRNANTGTERGNAMIEASLRKYGAGRSILIDKHGNIIAGNKTVENAGAAGMEDVIVVQTDGRKIVAVQRMDLDMNDGTAARELAIADNRAGELNLEWDAANLADLASEIDLSPFFTTAELVRILPDPVVELKGDEDAVPDLPLAAKTQLGDVYRLGEHRLMCGDATRLDDIHRLCDGEQVDMLLTDPPYNVAIGIQDVEDAKARNRRTDRLGIKNDMQDDDSFRRFLRDAFAAAYSVMRPGAAFYIWHAETESYNFRSACVEVGMQIRQCLVWNKNALVMGRQDYQWKHEPCLYGWKEGAAHTWLGDRKQTTVLEYDRPTRSEEHPTIKPVGLFEYLMLNNALPGAVVLDPFAGAGTTVITAEKRGRRALLMEIDPRYCDVIVTRWEKATGKKAELCPATKLQSSASSIGHRPRSIAKKSTKAIGKTASAKTATRRARS